MKRACAECLEPFEIEADEIRFLEKMRFDFGGQTVEIPPAVHCPDCRTRMRTAHRNEQHLYQRSSDLSGERMISLYAPDPPGGRKFAVYTGEEWHGDGWNPLDYGREYDFSRSFFEQFVELQQDVPRLGLVAFNNENSPYTTGTAYCKNCHLINCSENSEDCYYGKLIQSCKNCVDCSYAYHSELCYECFSVYNCYECVFTSYSQGSSNCWFSENLIGCSNCLFCTNLRRGQYCIENRQVSKQEFESELGKIRGSFSVFEEAKARWHKLRQMRIHRYANIVNSEGCSGDFITNSKNCRDSYDVNDSQDCRYLQVAVNVKDLYDCSNVYLAQELNYQMLGTIAAYHCAFSSYVFHSRDILYSDHIWHSHDLFGCVGIKNSSYAVLNREYSRNEYERLVLEIVKQMKLSGEWGTFFPADISPYCYNESLAYDYFPLTEEQARAKGLSWREQHIEAENDSETEVPDRIENCPDALCGAVLVCAASGKRFRITPQELKFYRSLGLPVPRKAPLRRHFDREQLRNKRKTFQRFCERCGDKIVSNFEPSRPEIVYCESCFNQEFS